MEHSNSIYHHLESPAFKDASTVSTSLSTKTKKSKKVTTVIRNYLNEPWHKYKSRAERYFFALSLTIAVMMIEYILVTSVGTYGVYFNSLAVIMLSTWYGMMGPGLVSLLFFSLTHYYFIAYSLGYSQVDIKEYIELTMFIGLGLLVIWVVYNMRRTQYELYDKALESEQLKEKFLLLLESTGEGIFGLDSEGRCTFINRAAQQMLGFSYNEVVGKRIHNLIHSKYKNGRKRPVAKCAMCISYKNAKSARRDNEVFWTKENTFIPVEYSTFPILDADKSDGAVVVFSNITQRKEAEQRKDEFISIASHEIKTPVTTALLLTQLLDKQLEKLPDSPVKVYVRKLEVQINRLRDLLHNLLDVTQIQSGKIKLQKEVVSVNKLLLQIIRNIQTINPTHPILFDQQDDIKVSGDKVRLRQLFENLITNAVKYSPAGSNIEVVVLKNNNSAQIRIKDFGKGIPSSLQKKIFERFYQIKNNKQKVQGLGLGLYICQQIALSHKGKIAVESKPGKGSTFIVSLPILKTLPEKN